MSEGNRFLGMTVEEIEALNAPDPQEPGPYGIGSDHWPGVGKVIEEMNELGTVFGKLMGSGGAREHWSGDLVQMMRDEIADVRAALDFLEELNRVLGDEIDMRVAHSGGQGLYGYGYMRRRYDWKRDLLRSWHRRDPEVDWPQPEHYGLPPRKSA